MLVFITCVHITQCFSLSRAPDTDRKILKFEGMTLKIILWDNIFCNINIKFVTKGGMWGDV